MVNGVGGEVKLIMRGGVETAIVQNNVTFDFPPVVAPNRHTPGHYT